MANENRLEFNEAAWDSMLQNVVDLWAEPRAEMIATAANASVHGDPPPAGKRHYMVGTEGSDPLHNGDYRATVIAVTNQAKADNARNNTLVRNFHLGGGA